LSTFNNDERHKAGEGGTLKDCVGALMALTDISKYSPVKAKVLGRAGATVGALKALEAHQESVVVQCLSLGIVCFTLSYHAEMLGQDHVAWTSLCSRAATIIKPMMEWDMLSHMLEAAAASPPGPNFTMTSAGFEKGAFQCLAATVIGALAVGKGVALSECFSCTTTIMGSQMMSRLCVRHASCPSRVHSVTLDYVSRWLR